MNNDIQIARFIASGNMSREDALHESESVNRQQDQKDTADKLKEKLRSRRENLARRTKEANKLRKQNPTIGDRLTKYKPKYSKMSRIGKDEGSLTGTGKFVGNVAKAGLNVGKAAVGGVAAARRMGDRIEGGKKRDRAALKVKAAQRMVNKAEAESIKSKTDSKPSKFAPPQSSEKKSLPASKSQKALPPAKPKPFGKDPDGSPSIGGLARSNKSIRRRLIKQRMVRKEEFIQEVKDKKEDKLDKIIDIMKGKNVIKVNPDVKEGTVIVKDAKGNDFVEIVDIISPSDVRSDWKKELSEGKKKGLWDNIHAKRKRGEKPAKPGDKDYPKTLNVEGAAWTKKAGKNPEGGLNEKGRKSYERENPGSDLKAPQPEGGSRKKSFCARMGGMKKKLTSSKTANDPDSRINKALRKWKC